MKMTKILREIMSEMEIDDALHFKNVCEFIDALNKNKLTFLCERESRVMGAVLNGDNFTEVGKRFDITKERVRQIFRKAVIRSIRAFRTYMNGVSAQQAEIKALQEDNFRLRSLLELKNSDMVDIELSRMYPNYSPKQIALLIKPIKELDVSVRLKNLCKFAELNNLGEVVALKTSDLLKYRNFGRKSLYELRDFLNKNGIKWA